MKNSYTLYAWQLSYFSGKTRCYLRYKGIPYVEKPINLYTLSQRIKKKTGAAVMPVVVTPEGEWLQDTSVIIDRLEQRFTDRPVIPQSPVQRFASYLLELWGDEWWIPPAMHYRWSYPENYALFQREGGDALLPYFPRALKNKAVAYAAKAMRRHLPGVGVVPAQKEMLERWTLHMLDLLEQHFAAQPFLLGSQPSLGDFSLIGTMYGHLGRDPWPKRELIAPRPHLRNWIDRMAEPTPTSGGGYLSDDRIAPTLAPVFQAIAREFIPMLKAYIGEVERALPKLAPGRSLPRGLGPVSFPMGDGPDDRYTRAALPYTLWMLQRMLDVYREMPAGDQAAVQGWLADIGGSELLTLKVPRLRRVALRVAPEN